MEQQGLDLNHYSRLLWKGKWVIMLTALVAVVGVIVFTGLQPEPAPTYRATATVKVEAVVNTPAALANATSVLTSDRSLNTEIQLIGSRNVMERALFKLQPDSVNNPPEVLALQISQLQRDISVRAVLNTNLLEIRAQDNSPVNAQKKANAIVEAYIDYVKETQSGAIEDALSVILAELAGVEQPSGLANNQLAALLPTLGSELRTIARSVEKSHQVITELQGQQNPVTVGLSLQQEVPQIERTARELSAIHQAFQGMSGIASGNPQQAESGTEEALSLQGSRLERSATDLNLIFSQIDDVRVDAKNLDPTRAFKLAIDRSDDAQLVLRRVPSELSTVRSNTLTTSQRINSIVSYVDRVNSDLRTVSARLQSALEGKEFTQSERVILRGQILSHTLGLATSATDLKELRERGQLEEFDGADIGNLAAAEGDIRTAIQQIDLLSVALDAAADTSTLSDSLTQSLNWIRESRQGLITVSTELLRVTPNGDPAREQEIALRTGSELEKSAVTLGVASTQLKNLQSGINDPLLQARLVSATNRLASSQAEIAAVATRLTGRLAGRTFVGTLDNLSTVEDRVKSGAEVLSATLGMLQSADAEQDSELDVDAAVQTYNNILGVVLSLDIATRQLQSLAVGNLDPLLAGELAALSERLTTAYTNVRVLSDRLASLASENPLGQHTGGLGAATYRLEFAVNTLQAAAESSQSVLTENDVSLLADAADEFKKQTDSGIANLSLVVDDLTAIQNSETSPVRYGLLSAATENIRLARDRALNLSSQLQQLQESRATRYFDLQQYRAELELSLLQPQDTGITLVDSPVSIAATAGGSTFFSSVQLPLGAVAGLFLGCLAVLLKAQISQAAGSPALLRNRLGMTVLGVIPRVRRSRHSSRTAAVEQDSLIFSEAMQLVGASLSGPLNHGSRSLLITSAVPREGKTAVTVQLARVLSQYGHRVVVVDGNLRKPEVAQRLDLPQQEGLSTALARQQNPLDYLVETPSFAVIPGGQSPPNPVELLSLPGMSSLVQQLQNRYDVVLIDAAPAIGFAEIRALASIVSGAILIVKGTSTSMDLVSKGQEELEAAGVPLVGTVINFAPDEECTHLKHDNYRPSKPSGGSGRRSSRLEKSGHHQKDEQPGEESVPSLTLR
jgi:capsular exopolysaccharide synthesis family protein